MIKIFLISTILRLFIVFSSQNIQNFDLLSYKKVGELTINHQNIYPQVAKIYHPYFPFYLYLEAIAIFLDNKLNINYVFFLKFINLIFDLGIIYLIYLLSNKKLKPVFFYSLNPISILIFFFHGQFDALPLFFILLSIYLLKQKKELFSIMSYSFAILTKTWPILFILPILKKIKNKKNLSLIFFFPLAFIITYGINFENNFLDIIKTPFTYRSLFSFWGLGRFIHLIFFRNQSQPPIYIQKIFLLIFLFIFFIYLIKINYKNLIIYFFDILLFFYIFTLGFSIQYFSWFIPFLFLVKPKSWYFLYLVTFLTVFINYLSWLFNFINNFIIIIVIFLNWLCFIFFLIYWKNKGFKSK
mgnify:CR=1 FL=1